MKKIKVLIQVKFILLLIIIGNSCSPVFSDLQSARTLGKNNTQISAHASSYSFTGDDETTEVQTNLGIQLSHGISPSIDIGIRYENVSLTDEEDDGINVLALVPKVSLVKNKMAFLLPVGKVLDDGDGNSWQAHPTLTFTLPAVENKIDINFSPKYIFTFCEECDDFIAFNLGAHFSKDITDWSVRAEYGLLFNPGEDGHFSQFSLGFAKTFGKKTDNAVLPETAN